VTAKEIGPALRSAVRPVLNFEQSSSGRLVAASRQFRQVSNLQLDHLQQREDHWAIVDLVGKAAHIWTVPVPEWVKAAIDGWLTAASITEGRVFRCVTRKGTVWGQGITEKVIWHVVKNSAASAGIAKLSPHDCRRTCARLCHAAGGELEQIQFLLGHVSVETTERYLGCKQRLRDAVNDKIRLELYETVTFRERHFTTTWLRFLTTAARPRSHGRPAITPVRERLSLSALLPIPVQDAPPAYWRCFLARFQYLAPMVMSPPAAPVGKWIEILVGSTIPLWASRKITD
jgi:hypothetical protein